MPDHRLPQSQLQAHHPTCESGAGPVTQFTQIPIPPQVPLLPQHFRGLLYVLPAMSLLAIVLLFPLGYVAYISLFSSNAAGEMVFSGGSNYIQLLQDSRFWNALSRTVIFTLGSVVFHMLLGVYAAQIANAHFCGRTIFRLIALSPWMFPSVVVAVTWVWIFQSQYGVMNDILVRIGFLSEPISWLGNETLAFPSVILASIWRGFPFVMIMTLAGLQAIPVEQYEAAAVDGAGSPQRFWYITLPNLRYILGVALMLDSIWMFRYFDLVQVMTGGGPGASTEVLAILVYKMSFEYFKFGMAAAIGIVMFGMMLILSLIYIRMVVREGQRG